LRRKLELRKFGKAAAELSSGLDLGLYFLRDAEKMDTGALPAALAQEPLLLRAVEELKMLAQTDLERERYEARRKALLDYNTGLKVARMEGREEGHAEGRAEGEISRIHLCERLAWVTNTCSFQTTGVELPAWGSATFQRTCSVALHMRGKFSSDAIP
jgi:hypothetical protein